MTRTRSIWAALIGLLIVALLAPLQAQNPGRARVTFVNATSTTVGPSRWGGTIYLTNATATHNLTIGNASSYRVGERVRVIDTRGSGSGNWTIVSVSNINGGANYSLNNDTYQGVELEAVANGTSATTATAFVGHAMCTACVAPSP